MDNNRRITSAKDCVDEIFNTSNILRGKREEAKKSCEISRRKNKQGGRVKKVLATINGICLLVYILLYSQKNYLAGKL